MRSRSTQMFACLAAAIGLLLAACSSETTKSAPPSGNGQGEAMLAGWQLTLPIANPSSGDADTVNPAKLSPPWLVATAGGALTFWAPVDGATTPNSGHARTELVNRTTFAAGKDANTLTAAVTVNQLPADNPDVIIGQIHGAQDIKSVPWVMLHYFDRSIKVVVKQAKSGSAAKTYELSDDVELGAPFTFTLSDDGNGTLTFGLDVAGKTNTATAPVPEAFVGQTVRFQVGAYQQAESSGDGAATSEDGARVTFTAITTKAS